MRSHEPIAEIPRPDNDERGFGEADANVAAAPELLEALQRLITDAESHGLTDNDAHLREARAAIAKATGQI